MQLVGDLGLWWELLEGAEGALHEEAAREPSLRAARGAPRDAPPPTALYTPALRAWARGVGFSVARFAVRHGLRAMANGVLW